MNGGVLIIGSLYWENKDNALDEAQGLRRSEWRKDLDFSKKIQVNVPILYGRKSQFRKETYTMTFSTSHNLGTAFIVPYKNSITSFEDLKNQAIKLSWAEGISSKTKPNILFVNWGVVGVFFKETVEKNYISEWNNEFLTFENEKFKFNNEDPSILKNGQLNFKVRLPAGIDYVFATPTAAFPGDFPTPQIIADAIINSKYDTYFNENYNNQIRTSEDEEIKSLINKTMKV